MTYFLKSWRTFYRNDELLDAMTNLLTSWHDKRFTSQHTLCRHGTLFDVITYFGRHDELFDVITHFLTSRRTFHVMMNILTSWRIFNIMTDIITHFLAPPAERQRSFSNADSSVVRRLSSVVVVFVVNFSLKMLISQKLPDNYFSFLVYSFIRKVPMFCINIDLIESS